MVRRLHVIGRAQEGAFRLSSRHSQGTRALTEGALLAALTIVLYVANVYTQLLIYVIPVPVAILVVRNGLRAGRGERSRL